MSTKYDEYSYVDYKVDPSIHSKEDLLSPFWQAIFFRLLIVIVILALLIIVLQGYTINELLNYTENPQIPDEDLLSPFEQIIVFAGMLVMIVLQAYKIYFLRKKNKILRSLYSKR